jgi:Flp pilus assembly protein TadD
MDYAVGAGDEEAWSRARAFISDPAARSRVLPRNAAPFDIIDILDRLKSRPGVGARMKLTPILSIGLAAMVAACGLDLGNTTSRGDEYATVVSKAEEARKAGDFDSAIPLYGRALQADPDGREAKVGLGLAYLSTDAADQAAPLFREVLASRGNDAAARRGLARALIAMGQPTLAERQLDILLRADARDFRALNAMGVVLDMEGRHAEAQARYREGIEVQPDYMPLRNNLGLSLAISGEYQAAIAVLVPLAGVRSGDGRARQNLAFAYAMAGDLENALQLSRVDLDESSAQQQLSYFMRLRSLPVAERSAELRRNPSFFPQSSGGAYTP